MEKFILLWRDIELVFDRGYFFYVVVWYFRSRLIKNYIV